MPSAPSPAARAVRRRRTPLRLEPVEDRLVPAVSAAFQLVNDWGAGFQGAVRLSNDQPAPVQDWRLEFDFPYQITQIWNGVVASHVGDHYVINNAGYNRTVSANGSVEFGFLGAPGGVTTFPTHFALNGIPLDGPPPPAVSVGDVTVAEGDGGSVTASFPVTLSAPVPYSVSVRYTTADGTARAGSDYTAAGGTVTFQPGETQKEIPVAVSGDLLDEDDETFTLTLSDPVAATLGTARGQATIQDNDPPPSLTVSDVTTQEPTTAGVDPGYFGTDGNQVVDAAGRPVKIAGVNWFGFETNTFAPHGLWARNYRDMMDQMKQLGFNTIRLPFSGQLFDPGSTPNGIDFSKNPDLQGLTGLQVLDKIVDYAGQVGLRIILDHHRAEAGAGAQDSGLWYTSAYPESRWVSDWQMLAARYAGNPTVIGADLHNEPHGPATWGGGGPTDWRPAAERAGNAILAANPNWLILVEGVENAGGRTTWWGGNLANAGSLPVRLTVAGRLVYSPHDYPASVFPQPWFSDPSYPQNLYGVWDATWGYLFRQGTAPVVLGEYGSKLETASDKQWLDTLVNYLGGDLNGDGTTDLGIGQQGMSWTWWSWNPNSGDTGGILQDDWTTPIQAKINALGPIQFPWAGSGGPAAATFLVNLSAPSGKPVTVQYATADGSATAGQDYTATAGTLTFAPGETSKPVPVPVLPDNQAEADETFSLKLTSPQNATVADDEGVATIRDAAAPSPPTIRAGDIQVTEGDAGTSTATFTVTLSAPSADPVTVQYATADGAARAGQDYQTVSGTLTFDPGQTTKTVDVPVVGDPTPEPTETFRLELSNPTNATLSVPQATGTILDNDSPLGGVRVTFKNRDDWGAGFVADMAIVNDGPTPVNGWTLEFDLDRSITNIWNAEIVSHVGSHYVLRAAAWNSTVPAGGRVDFGFQGATGNLVTGPQNYVLNGVPLP